GGWCACRGISWGGEGAGRRWLGLLAEAAARFNWLVQGYVMMDTSNWTSKHHAHLGVLVSPAIAFCGGGSRSTKGVVGGSFTLSARIAFGHGCDWPRYGAASFLRLRLRRKKSFSHWQRHGSR